MTTLCGSPPYLTLISSYHALLTRKMPIYSSSYANVAVPVAALSCQLNSNLLSHNAFDLNLSSVMLLFPLYCHPLSAHVLLLHVADHIISEFNLILSFMWLIKDCLSYLRILFCRLFHFGICFLLHVSLFSFWVEEVLGDCCGHLGKWSLSHCSCTVCGGTCCQDIVNCSSGGTVGCFCSFGFHLDSAAAPSLMTGAALLLYLLGLCCWSSSF